MPGGIMKTPTSAADPRVQAILGGLAAAYPHAECALVHHSAWELLAATILSAQCTDARVNQVTPALFAKYPTVAEIAALTPERLEPEIRSTGFYRTKAKSIVGAARRIVEAYNGQVPADMDALLTLPGVARKTANVVLGVWFHQAAGIVVDTHVHRISRRLDLTREDTPEKIERDLMRLIPRPQWIAFGHRVIAHGRQCCLARAPRCAACPIERQCFSSDKTYSCTAAKKPKAGSKPKPRPKAAAGHRPRSSR
jgi:endonuclease-3